MGSGRIPRDTKKNKELALKLEKIDSRCKVYKVQNPEKYLREEKMESLMKMTVGELKAKAKEMGVPYYSKMKKAELVEKFSKMYADRDESRDVYAECMKMTVKELKAKAKEVQLQGYTTMKREELVREVPKMVVYLRRRELARQEEREEMNKRRKEAEEKQRRVQKAV